MMEPVRIGLLGLGRMGRNHLRVLDLLRTVDLRWVYDTDEEGGRARAADVNVRFADDLEQDLQEVEAVVIATPTSTHYDYVLQCSRHVANLFVEKPLADSLDETVELADLAESRGLKLQVGFIERFNPAVLALKRVVDGERMINLDLTRTNKLSARITDVDVVSDLMIHDIDLALFVNGPVEDVEAYGVIEHGFIAFARANLRHENGAYSSITASRITEKRIRHIAATTESMYVDCNLLAKEVMITRQSVEQYSDRFAITAVEQTIDVRLEEALLLEQMAFVDFVRGEGGSVPDHVSARRAFEVVERVRACVEKST